MERCQGWEQPTVLDASSLRNLIRRRLTRRTLFQASGAGVATALLFLALALGLVGVISANVPLLLWAVALGALTGAASAWSRLAWIRPRSTASARVGCSSRATPTGGTLQKTRAPAS